MFRGNLRPANHTRPIQKIPKLGAQDPFALLPSPVPFWEKHELVILLMVNIVFIAKAKRPRNGHTLRIRVSLPRRCSFIPYSVGNSLQASGVMFLSTLSCCFHGMLIIAAPKTLARVPSLPSSCQVGRAISTKLSFSFAQARNFRS